MDGWPYRYGGGMDGNQEKYEDRASLDGTETARDG